MGKRVPAARLEPVEGQLEDGCFLPPSRPALRVERPHMTGAHMQRAAVCDNTLLLPEAGKPEVDSKVATT